MLIQGPCGHPCDYFLIFLTSKSDPTGRKTYYMCVVIQNSYVIAKITEVMQWRPANLPEFDGFVFDEQSNIVALPGGRLRGIHDDRIRDVALDQWQSRTGLFVKFGWFQNEFVC